MKNEITTLQVKRLRELYEGGMLLRLAAADAGMSITTARVHLKRLGVQMRNDRGKYDRGARQ